MESHEDLSALAAEQQIRPDVAPFAAAAAQDTTRRRGPGIWWLLLLLVIVFGYLNAARRESLGRFFEQVADIVRDFRGYEPEF